jgi:arsenate reductase
VVLYLETPLDAAQLRALVAEMGVPVREVMRKKEAIYKDNDMDGAQWTDDELYQQMAQHPILLNRPVVRTPLGIKLCRPSEVVLELLSPEQQALVGSFTKEDGEVVGRK